MVKRKTTEQFIKELKVINPEITVLGEYTRSQDKIKVKYICGHIWKTTAGNLLKGTGCLECYNKKIKKTQEQFIEELKVINPEITVVGEYTSSKNKIKVQHICGHIWKTEAGSLLKGTGCSKCANKKKRKTTKQFIEELKFINSEITVLGEYTGAKNKINVKHTCGHIWITLAESLLNGTGCPRCNESKGERWISKLLDNLNIQYKKEFKLLKNPLTGRYLRSDFAIFNKENSVELIIEYDGEQHYKPIKHFGGRDSFNKTKECDLLKDQYCLDNKISYIRFNYKQSFSEIESLLLNKLKKYHIIQI